MNFLLWIFNDLLVKKSQNAQKRCQKKAKAHNGTINTKLISKELIAIYPSSLNEIFLNYPLNVKIANFDLQYLID